MTAVTAKTCAVTATVVAAVCAALTASGIATAQPPVGGCAPLHVLGVQGTGQSSPAADPVADTGVVGALIGPVLASAPGAVARSYIPYAAGFGGAVPGGGAAPYAVSVTEARQRLDSEIGAIAAACPNTMFAGVGYSQGAQALSWLARDIGSGAGPVPADRVAGIALYAHPDRAPGSPVFPGRPGKTVPDPAPGTAGGAVAGVRFAPAAPGGGGIAGGDIGYGALTGRVADICVEGDLACAAPDHAALLRLGALIAAQADLRDPITALNSLHGLIATALGAAWITVLLHDIHLTDGNVAYRPEKSLAQRLIDAADPRHSDPSPAEAATADACWSAVVSTVMANPAATLPALAAQLTAAWGQLVADNAALVDPAVWIRYGHTVSRHTGYAAGGHLNSGIAWMTALAQDVEGSRS
ncbi:cutinase family protein [Nocardia sp. NPDC058499]|uniref:cutinase family protein n=1 Tax=Nocardia sp. NPDC058499 TaxID=3346530 RepID=UPI003652E22A